jgi:hypothetical protein
MGITRKRFLSCIEREKEILLEIEEKYKGKDWRELDDNDPNFKAIHKELIEVMRDINEYLSN